MSTGEKIRAARKYAGLTQKELAEKLGISYVGISQWENDIRKPKFDTLIRIAEALNVPVGTLMDQDLSPFYKENAKKADSSAPLTEEQEKQIYDKLSERLLKPYKNIAQHFDIMEDRKAFLQIYDDCLNDLGKAEIHKYTEYLITKPEYLQQGITPASQNKAKDDEETPE